MAGRFGLVDFSADLEKATGPDTTLYYRRKSPAGDRRPVCSPAMKIGGYKKRIASSDLVSKIIPNIPECESEIARSTMEQTTQTPNEMNARGLRRMWGLSLDFWNNIIVAFLALGAFAAVIVGVATYIAFQLQEQETQDANAALERYKIGVAAQVADAKREGIEAGKTAGDALVRAAALEKEATDARLATVKIKAQLSWRTLSKEVGEKLETELAKHPGKVNLRYTDGDPEALFLAIQISA